MYNLEEQVFDCRQPGLTITEHLILSFWYKPPTVDAYDSTTVSKFLPGVKVMHHQYVDREGAYGCLCMTEYVSSLVVICHTNLHNMSVCTLRTSSYMPQNRRCWEIGVRVYCGEGFAVMLRIVTSCSFGSGRGSFTRAEHLYAKGVAQLKARFGEHFGRTRPYDLVLPHVLN